MVSERRYGRRLYSGPLLRPDQELPKSTGDLCRAVRLAYRIGSGSPAAGAHAPAPRFRSGCRKRGAQGLVTVPAIPARALHAGGVLRVQGRLSESLAGIPRRTGRQPGLRSRSYTPGRRVLAPQPLRRSRDSLAALHVAGLYRFRALRDHGKGVSQKGTTGAGRANPAARHRHGPQ